MANEVYSLKLYTDTDGMLYELVQKAPDGSHIVTEHYLQHEFIEDMDLARSLMKFSNAKDARKRHTKSSG